MTGRIVLTGATGFVGSAVALELLDSTDAEVLCLTRAADPETANLRLREWLARAATLYQRTDLLPAIATRTRAVAGDIAAPGIAGGLPATGVDLLIHTAASLRFADQDAAELYRVNVEGSRAVARYSERVGAGRFVHMSTAFVAGRRRGLIREDDPPPGDFHNAYERSKAAGERAVQEIRPDAAIVRPGIVIGHGVTAATMSNTGFYAMLKVAVQLRRIMQRRNVDRPIRFLADPRVALNLIPVDLVARATVRVALADTVARVFHLTNDQPPSLGDAVATARRLLGLHLVFTDSDAELDDVDRRMRSTFHEPYLSSDLMFDTTNAAQVCDPGLLSYPMDAAEIDRFSAWFLANSPGSMAHA